MESISLGNSWERVQIYFQKGIKYISCLELGDTLDKSSLALWMSDAIPLLNQMSSNGSFLSWLLSVHDECRRTETISTHGGLCYIVPKLLHQCSLYASSHFFPENRVTFLSLGILGKAMHAQHFANNFKQFMESVNLFLRV